MEYDPNKTAAYLAGKVDEYVKQQARDTIVQNTEADENARYARIPDGNACDFCKMLGSRGFVYHSEELAGGKGNKYHPYCNCQIAVSFDPFMVEYWQGMVKVRRGYDSEASGIDIDALYEEYIKAGKRYTSGSRFRDYTGGTVYKMTQEKLIGYRDMLDAADTIDELHAVGDEIVKEINAHGKLHANQWEFLSDVAKARERELLRKPARLADVPFVKAKTAEEAAERIEQYVDMSAYKSKLDVKGLDIIAANDLLKTLDAVYGSYDVPKLHSIQRMNKRSNAFRDTTADAAYQWLIGDLFYNADYFKTAKAIEAHKRQANDLVQEVLGMDLEAYKVKHAGNKAKMKYVEALERTKRPTVGAGTDYMTEASFAHELGHMLDEKIFRKVKDFDVKSSADKYASGVSAYATTSQREYIAESFAAFYFGEVEILDQELVALFEEAMK